MPTEAKRLSSNCPAAGVSPTSPAPAAPAKPMWLSAWPANVWLRKTTKYPTIAADDGRDRAGGERVAHEIIIEELAK